MGYNGVYKKGYKMLGKLKITLPYKITKSNTNITAFYSFKQWLTSLQKTSTKRKKR